MKDTDLLKSWSEIDWRRVNNEVKRLRSRIFQARKEGKLRKLRSLQQLMLKSSSNILYSIRTISSNKGSKTYGIDGKILKTSKDKLDLFYEIRNNKYKGKEPSPSRRIYIKEPNKMRPIGIPTIYDRVIQTIVKNSLEPEWESVFEKGSYGFRPGRNIDDAVSRIFGQLNTQGSKKWIIDTDIHRCFDSIQHKYLINLIKNHPASSLIKKWLKAGITVRDIWLDSGEDGTPQGSAISPLLCNIALHGLETDLGITYNSRGHIDTKSRCLIRFADDLVIICHSYEDCLLAIAELEKALEIRGLEISKLKTRIVHVTQGFDFLGYNFKLFPKRHVSKFTCMAQSENDFRVNQDKMGIYITPSVKSVKKIKSRIKEVFKKYASNTTKIFIKKMNEVIRGYAQAKWHWHSSRTFSLLTCYCYILCWRFALRRHKNKSKKWMKDRYFTSLNIGNVKGDWYFYDIFDKSNKYEEKFMYKFNLFKIVDHVKCKMDKIPDNKEDRQYFKQLNITRGIRRPFNILFKLDKTLAESQGHTCPVCSESLYNDLPLNMHHIKPISERGEFSFSNLVLIHEECHIDLHSSAEKLKHYKIMLFNYRRNHPRKKNKQKH